MVHHFNMMLQQIVEAVHQITKMSHHFVRTMQQIIKVVHHTSHWLLAFNSLREVLKKDPQTFVLVGQVLPLGTVAYLAYLLKPYNYGVFLHGMDFTFAIGPLRCTRPTYSS